MKHKHGVCRGRFCQFVGNFFVDKTIFLTQPRCSSGCKETTSNIDHGIGMLGNQSHIPFIL
jgi:hypothetical protein